MKLSDVSAAVALIINGYLRANDAAGNPESHDLMECLGAIEQECKDWAENLENAP